MVHIPSSLSYFNLISLPTVASVDKIFVLMFSTTMYLPMILEYPICVGRKSVVRPAMVEILISFDSTGLGSPKIEYGLFSMVSALPLSIQRLSFLSDTYFKTFNDFLLISRFIPDLGSLYLAFFIILISSISSVGDWTIVATGED